ncbi:MAG: DUF4294 domain-containing protein [Paludibacter sp.]
MKLFKGFQKSHVIATVSTLLIHLLLLILIGNNFSEEQSSALSDADLYNLDANLEDFITEDFNQKPVGKDPLANESNKDSESISKDNGAVKAIASTTPPLPETNTEVVEQTPLDTVVKRIEQVQLLKVDTPQVKSEDIAMIASLSKKNTNKTSSSKHFNNEKERYDYYLNNYKMIRNFRKVYPYALKTREIIETLNAQLASIPSDAEKRKLIRDTEKELFQEYESAVRTMSTSQGKLLLKLIARETNKTAFELIKGYKGGFTASFWYGVGRIFNTDLKSEFHKETEDSLIEDVLTKYQKNDLY